MRRYKKYVSWLLAVPALTLLFGSCSESDDFLNNSINNEIRFRVVEETNWNATRAAAPLTNYDPIPVKGIDGEQLYVHTFVENGIKSEGSAAEMTRGGKILTTSDLQTIGVIGYKYNQGEDPSTVAPFFYNKLATKKSDGSFSFAKGLYWPSANERFSFYAFAPEPYRRYNSWGNNFAFNVYSQEADPGKPQLFYRVQDDVDAVNHDIVVAEAENVTAGGGTNGIVDLTFRHILTRLKFVIGANNPSGYRISNITLDNVLTAGVYTYGDGWDGYDSGTGYGPQTDDLSINCDISTNQTNGTEIKPYGESASYYDDNNNEIEYEPQIFVIPQTLGVYNHSYEKPSITITIYRESDNSSAQLFIPLDGQEWEAGKTVTYAISTSALNYLEIGSTNITTDLYSSDFGVYFYKGGSVNFHLSPYDSDITKIQAGDKAGLFIVNSSGKVTSANLPVTFDGTKWALDNRMEFDNDNAAYFFYFPYQSTIAGSPLVGDDATTNGNSYEQFFANVVDQWTIINDGTLQGWKSNLHIGGTSDTNLSSISRFNFYRPNIFTIAVTEHIGTPVVMEENAYTYTLAGYGSWIANRVEMVMPSTTFPANMTPVKYTDGETDYYVYLVRSSTDTEISATGENGWTMTVNTHGSGSSSTAYTPITITPSNEPTQGSATPTAYELRVGDVYFSDGSIGHTSLDCSSTPIGIVTYVDNSTTTADDLYTEKNTKAQGIGGHGLVMCLDMHSSTNVRWKSGSSTADNRPKITDMATLEDAISGYTESAAMYDDNHPAIKAAMEYNTLPAPEEKSTGWFLPTAAQWAKTFASLFGKNVDNYTSFSSYMYYFSPNVNGEWQTILSRVGLVEQYGSTFDNLQYITSSEYSDSYYVYLYSPNDTHLGFSTREKSGYTITRIWPFLAF